MIAMFDFRDAVIIRGVTLEHNDAGEIVGVCIDAEDMLGERDVYRKLASDGMIGTFVQWLYGRIHDAGGLSITDAVGLTANVIHDGAGNMADFKMADGVGENMFF